MTKPLGKKAYGHIGHLPGSRMTPADHHVHEGQARICTEKPRDRRDVVIVQEKLDGTCMSVALIEGEIVPLMRAGHLATESRFEMHHMFHDWVMENEDRFRDILGEGERVIGEWLAQAHSTRYELKHEPFVVFDIMTGNERLPTAAVYRRARVSDFEVPKLISIGPPVSIEKVLDELKISGHGAIDPVEGAVWRVERDGRVDFLAKYVRPDKEDGIYLPEISGNEAVWNWKPKGEE